MASFASSHQADLLVLGGGIAGMLLAERALARGRRVTLVERGTPMSFETRLKHGSHADPLPFNRGRLLSPHQDPKRPYLFLPVYNLGGSTNSFYGNMPRIHPAHFERASFGGADRRWAVTYAALEPYYLAAERRLRVSGNSRATPFRGKFDYPLPPHRLSPMDRACQAIFGPEHVMQVPTVRPPTAVDARPACCGANLCELCPIDSKGTALNTVFPAIKDKLELHTGLLVVELLCRGGRVEGAVARDAKGERHLFAGRQVVVAANGIDSCLLLLRSPSVPQHPALGRHYMDHPAFGLAVYGTGLETRPGYGDSAQTAMITSFFESVASDLPVSVLGEVKSGELANDAGGSNRDQVVSDVVRLSLDSRYSKAAGLRDRVRENWRQALYLRFLVETQPLASNTLRVRELDASGQPIPEVRLRYPSYFDLCIERVSAHVKKQLPGAEVKLLNRSPGVQHWMGATRMGESAEDACVDRELRYFGLENLYVLSASSFPGCSSANPTLTLAALALRLAAQLA